MIRAVKQQFVEVRQLRAFGLSEREIEDFIVEVLSPTPSEIKLLRSLFPKFRLEIAAYNRSPPENRAQCIAMTLGFDVATNTFKKLQKFHPQRNLQECAFLMLAGSLLEGIDEDLIATYQDLQRRFSGCLEKFSVRSSRVGGSDKGIGTESDDVSALIRYCNWMVVAVAFFGPQSMKKHLITLVLTISEHREISFGGKPGANSHRRISIYQQLSRAKKLSPPLSCSPTDLCIIPSSSSSSSPACSFSTSSSSLTAKRGRDREEEEEMEMEEEEEVEGSANKHKHKLKSPRHQQAAHQHLVFPSGAALDLCLHPSLTSEGDGDVNGGGVALSSFFSSSMFTLEQQSSLMGVEVEWPATALEAAFTAVCDHSDGVVDGDVVSEETVLNMKSDQDFEEEVFEEILELLRNSGVL